MIPGRQVVAGPRGRVALCPGIRGAREHERPFVGLQSAQAIVGRAGIFHSENVVDRAVIESRAVIQTMNDVEWHGLLRIAEDGGFIHVVPKARQAHSNKVFVKTAPPIPHTRESEIGENAFPRPDGPNEQGTIGILDEYIIFYSRIEWGIAVVRKPLDMEIRDGNDVETQFSQVGDHFFKSGEILPVDRKRGVAFLIVNIEVDGVGRNFLFAQEPCDLPHAGFGIVAVAALLVTEGPERRQRRAPRERGVLLDDFFRLRPCKEIIIQFSTFRAEGKIVRGLFAEIESAAVSVVEE